MATNNQGGRPPKPTAETILNGKLIEAADKGDRLEMLKQLRKLLATRIESNNSDRDLAALARQLRQTEEEVEAEQERRDAEDRGSWLDDMRAAIGYPNPTPKEIAKIKDGSEKKPPAIGNLLRYHTKADVPGINHEDDEDDYSDDEDDALGYWKKNPQKGAS